MSIVFSVSLALCENQEYFGKQQQKNDSIINSKKFLLHVLVIPDGKLIFFFTWPMSTQRKTCKK